MYKKIIFFLHIVIALIAGMIIGERFSTYKNQPSFNPEINQPEITTIRIGWQSGWAPQAQLAQVLKHTDILEKNGLQGEFNSFSYGAPLNEAALTGDVDVIFTGDFPAINLLSKSDKWVIVSRLIDFRAGIIVPKNSPYQSVADLKGTVVSGPYGSGTHLHVIAFLKEQGFDPQKDFQLQNLDILEQSSIIQKGTAENWGDVAGFISWDPTIGLQEATGKARILKLVAPQAFVVMSNDFILSHPESAKNFVRSFIEGYYFYAKNQQLANDWFVQEVKSNIPTEVLDQVASLEQNLKATSITDINISLDEKRLVNLEKIVDEAVKNGFLKEFFDIRKEVNQVILEEVRKKISEFDIDNVKF